MIHILKQKSTQKQIAEMLEALGTYIKLAVDIERQVAAGGGYLHADCEALLLEDGSTQDNIWGADWIPRTQQIRYEAFINIRPKQNNRSMEITDPAIREKVRLIVEQLFGGE